MIRVHRPHASSSLKATVQADLAGEHAQAKGYKTSDPRIRVAWKRFRERAAGQAIVRAIQDMFRHKCAFCENINANAIDHFWPKERYPKKMFVWSNLILCCALCNQLKGSKFPFRDGQPVFIDPTGEEPLEFFVWDFQTGAIDGVVTDPTRQHRANVTRDELGLDAGPLREERRIQFSRVLQLLADVVNDNPVRQDTLRRLREELQPERPYLGIVRFLFRQPNAFSPIITEARAKLPEIDAWVAAWL